MYVLSCPYASGAKLSNRREKKQAYQPVTCGYHTASGCHSSSFPFIHPFQKCVVVPVLFCSAQSHCPPCPARFSLTIPSAPHNLIIPYHLVRVAFLVSPFLFFFSGSPSFCLSFYFPFLFFLSFPFTFLSLCSFLSITTLELLLL